MSLVTVLGVLFWKETRKILFSSLWPVSLLSFSSLWSFWGNMELSSKPSSAPEVKTTLWVSQEVPVRKPNGKCKVSSRE